MKNSTKNLKQDQEEYQKTLQEELRTNIQVQKNLPKGSQKENFEHLERYLAETTDEISQHPRKNF